MKKCTSCQEIKPVTEFHSNKANRDGKSNKCRTCANGHTRRHYRKNVSYYLKRNKVSRKKNAEIISNYKRGLACSKCGFSHIAAIDFHHPDPTIKDLNGLRRHRSIKSIMNEIKKCIPLCSNCHRILHYEQRLVPAG